MKKDGSGLSPVKLPSEFADGIKKEYGGEAEAFLAAYEAEPVSSLRLNPLKDKVDITKYFPTATDRVPWEERGRYYSRQDQPGRHPLHSAGAYYIQEASAMMPAALLMREPLREGERILDLCAAPGGKSTQIAGYMMGRGLLICNEYVSSRAKILSENIERMGVENAVVLNHDPAYLAERFGGFFSRIMADAPCSGEGMFRKHPEAADEWSPENVEMCAGRQDEILDRAAEMLMSGGLMVYSTCTFSRKEDEDCVDRFLQRHTDFELVDIKQNPVKLLPYKDRGEGQFAAVFKRKGKLPETLSGSGVDRSLKRPGREELKFLEEFVGDNINKDYVNCNYVNQADGLALFGKNLYLLPEQVPALSGLKLQRCGLHLGCFEKKRFEPAHAWAMALGMRNVKKALQMDAEGAESYLKGMTVPAPSDVKGWVLVTFEGLPLGWGKASGGVLKNHYPRGLRLV